jgi:hypothetical protein
MIDVIDYEELRRILDYNFITGEFRWRPRPNLSVRKWSLAGGINGDGYIEIKISRKRYLAHRLAWLYMTGEWPPIIIDHANGIQINNTWINIRAATISQNRCNSKRGPGNKSGYKGVTWSKRSKKWMAQIGWERKTFYLGVFDDPELAHEAYKIAAKNLHGEFACFGSRG